MAVWAVALGVVVVPVAIGWATSPTAAATKAGDASVIVPDDGRAGAGQPLTSGVTTTPFSLRLPTSASCRGDSANEGYRVQTYMVPANVDPGSLTFGSVGPLPTATGAAFREPLFETTSNPVVNVQTAAATKPPGPGPIINIPAMNFAVYKQGDVPAGTYNVGIACTRGQPSGKQLDTYWNVRLDVKDGLGGPGAGPLWTVTGNPDASPGQATAAGAAVSSKAKDGSGTSAGGRGSSSARRSQGAHSRTLARPADPAPTGAPPSFHLPVTQLFPHVGRWGAWALLILGVGLLALAGPLLALMIRRNRHAVRTWPTPGLPAIPQEGR